MTLASQFNPARFSFEKDPVLSAGWLSTEQSRLVGVPGGTVVTKQVR